MTNTLNRAGFGAIGIALALLLLLSLGAPRAHAGLLTAPATDCADAPLETPFTRWLDPMRYTLMPGGDLEPGAAGWQLSGARVVAGNEPFKVGGAGDAYALSIPAGKSAISPTACAGLAEPTMRFFARSSGGGLLGVVSLLKVDVLWEGAGGSINSLPLLPVALQGSWGPTLLPTPIIANLLPLGGKTPIAFRFTAVGTASWTIDDVYLDPFRRS